MSKLGIVVVLVSSVRESLSESMVGGDGWSWCAADSHATSTGVFSDCAVCRSMINW